MTEIQLPQTGDLEDAVNEVSLSLGKALKRALREIEDKYYKISNAYKKPKNKHPVAYYE